MTEYNFISDFLDTFQTSPDWIKAVWLLMPPGFFLMLIALLVRWRIVRREVESATTGELIYSIRRDSNNLLHVISHVPLLEARPPLLLPEFSSTEEPGSQNSTRLAPPA